MKGIVAASVLTAAILGWSPLAYAQRWVPCASEGEFCRAPYGAIIHFGAEGAFAHRRNERGGLPCDNRVFGDPAVGVHKQCFFSFGHRDEGDDEWRPHRHDWRY